MLRADDRTTKADGSVVSSSRVLYLEEEEQSDTVQHDTGLPITGHQPDTVERDDDAMTETSRTDDDPVGDAFRQVLDGSDRDIDIDEDQDDEIVWNPR